MTKDHMSCTAGAVVYLGKDEDWGQGDHHERDDGGRVCGRQSISLLSGHPVPRSTLRPNWKEQI